MTTAQQDADTATPRDLTDAAAAREKARQYIETYRRENGGALPSGPMVAKHVGQGLTDKWGQNQLRPFKDAAGAAAPIPPPVPPAAPRSAPAHRNGTVGDLVAERSGPGAVSAVIKKAVPERSSERSGARPAERHDPPPAPASERSGAGVSATIGTARPRTGTPAEAATGTPTVPTGWQRFGRFLVGVLALAPLYAIGAGAFVSIWGGWVGLGQLTGFGEIELLPGIVPGWKVNTAITLPLGMEAYAAYALKVWLRPPPGLSDFARTFARRSALGALGLGACGQIAYHLMTAARVEHAHWLITAFVATLPVAVLGLGAALTHLVRHPEGAA